MEKAWYKRDVRVNLLAWVIFWGLSLFSGNVVATLIAGFLLASPFLWPDKLIVPSKEVDHGDE